MSTLKVNNLQVGQDTTATNNFTLYQPSTLGGTVRLGVGNVGAVTDILTADSAGKVGIGTTNPTAKLHVYAPSQRSYFDAGSGYTTIDLVTNSSRRAFYGYNVSTQQWQLANVTNAGAEQSILLYDRTYNYLSLRTGDTEAIYIKSDQNIGIGTNNPTVKLDVSGHVRSTKFRGTVTTSGNGQSNAPFQFESDWSSWMIGVAANPAETDNSWGLFWAGNVNAKYGTNQTGGPGNIWSNLSNPNEFVFVGNDTGVWSVHAESGNVWQKGNLIVNEKVGIGTTNPPAKFAVSGTTAGAWASVLSNPNNRTAADYQRGFGTSHPVHIIGNNDGTTDGEAGFLVLSSGDVTPSAGDTLGFIEFNAPESGKSQGNASLKAAIACVLEGSGGSTSGHGGTFRFYTKSDNFNGGILERLTISHHGTVGIGTGTPNSAELLHIYSTADAKRGLRVEQTDTSSYAEIKYLTPTRDFRMGVGAASAGETALRNNWYLYDGTSSNGIICTATSGTGQSGRLESNRNYNGLTFVKLTTPTVYNATFSATTDVTVNVNTTFGVPTNAKAILVTGHYNVTGYSLGSGGQGDHAVSHWRYNNGWSSAIPWSFNTSTDTGWGEYIMYHDGDVSETGDMHYYGAWIGSGVITVNSNGNIYGRLGWGYSGGTHYNTLWCWGYWV